MRRREFIRQSIALAGALPAAAGLASAANRSLPSPGNLHVLVDTRYPASRRYGELAAARGARVSHYDGDLTGLWQHTLLPQWRAGRSPMAGISTERGWFCLAQLAGEHRWTASASRMKGSELVSWTLTPGARA